MRRIIALGLLLLLPAIHAHAQAAPSTALAHPADPMPTYEVATIKPWEGKTFGFPLRFYIQNSFGIANKSVQRLIGPDWIDKKSWVIQGKPSAELTASMQQMTGDQRVRTTRLLAQSLLADRFKMKYHFETREMTVFELTQAKGGFKIKPVENPDPHGGASMGPRGQLNNLHMVSGPIWAAAMMIASDGDLGGSPLIDKTGITGAYTFDLDWLPTHLAYTPSAGSMIIPGAQGPPPAEGTVGPSLNDALEQVGLKLVRTKGPVEVVVIDHIEEPTPN